MQMILEDRDEWCEALESDQFPQGRGNLEALGRFCCLGVLSKLQAAKGHVYRLPSENLLAPVWYSDDPNATAEGISYVKTIGALTPGLARRFSASYMGLSVAYLDLPSEVQKMRRGSSASYLKSLYNLGTLNDAGVPFRLMAQIIRQQVQIIQEYSHDDRNPVAKA